MRLWKRRVTEERSGEWGNSTLPTYWEYLRSIGSGGGNVDDAAVLGLPAVGMAIGLIAETAATLPCHVYSGTETKRRLADGNWQYPLLNSDPGGDLSSFDFWSDVFASVESCGNALVQKIKNRGKVVELIPLDMDYCQIRKVEGNKIFEVREEGKSRPSTYTPDDIIHVRGFTPKGGVVGLNPIARYRQSLGAAVSMERFTGRYFDNNAQGGFAIEFPPGVTETQAENWKKVFDGSHAGADNAFKTVAIGGGAKIVPLQISLQDAQFVEGQRWGVEQTARVFRVMPPEFLLLGIGGPKGSQEDRIRFLTFTMLPRLRRVESCFRRDSDLFGRGNLFPEFATKILLRADTATQAAADKSYVQTGVQLPDEIRAASLGLDPLPDGLGQIPQITPVGGAPNPAPHDGSEPVDPSSEN